MAKTTFLTGATGFIGSAIARLLIAKGHHVKVLTRPNNNRHNLNGLNVEIIEGDLIKPSTYAHALKDCSTLLHVAADYRLWVPDPGRMHKVNVHGTRTLLLSALNAGIERMVYTSSVATLGLNGDGSPADEATPSHFSDMIGTYKQSKYLAEEQVWQLIRQNNLPAIIVNPTTPLGPRDIKPTPTGRIIADAIAGRIPAYVDTGLNIVHVDDVAMGHWLALERGNIGERYILGGENLTLKEILYRVAEQEGYSAPKIKLSSEVVYPIAACLEILARITGKEPRVCLDALRMSKNKMFFSSAKAEIKLGYTARPAHLAITDAIAWFRKNQFDSH